MPQCAAPTIRTTRTSVSCAGTPVSSSLKYLLCQKAPVLPVCTFILGAKIHTHIHTHVKFPLTHRVALIQTHPQYSLSIHTYTQTDLRDVKYSREEVTFTIQTVNMQTIQSKCRACRLDVNLIHFNTVNSGTLFMRKYYNHQYMQMLPIDGVQ